MVKSYKKKKLKISKKNHLTDIDRVLKIISNPRELAALLLLAIDNYSTLKYAEHADGTPFGNLPTINVNKQRSMKDELEDLCFFIDGCCPSRMGLKNSDVNLDECNHFLNKSLEVAKKYDKS